MKVFSHDRRMPGRVKAGDIVLVVLVIFAAVISMFLVSRANAGEKGSLAIIEVNGKEAKRIALGDGQPDRTFRIKGMSGYNIVEVKDGRVRMLKADCRDRICLGVGWVEAPGRAIICLPHRVIVRVTGKRGGNGKVDTVTE